MSGTKHKRFMVFVDGTNFLCQIARVLETKYDGQKPPLSAFDAAIAFISKIVSDRCAATRGLDYPYRQFWFGSYKGDSDYYDYLRSYLRDKGFEPVLFKAQDSKEKGVDIALTRQMLLNAFQNNYDIGLVIAGDEDYVELINDVKRFGIYVMGSFFEGSGLSKELKLSFDQFISMDKQQYIQRNIEEFKNRVRSELSNKQS